MTQRGTSNTARGAARKATAVGGTRQRILDAALASLRDGGTDILNMGDVARRAGVSRQAVYLHFGSRAALAIEAVRWLDDVENVDAATAPIREAASVDAALDALATFLGHFNPRIADVARMMYRMRGEPEIEAAWQDRLMARRRGVRALARRLADDGRLRAPFTVDTATDWLTAMTSVMLWEELTQDQGWSTKRYVQHLAAMFRATLVAPAGGD